MKKIAILKINHRGYKKGDVFTRDNLVYIYKGENAFGTLYVETEPDIFEIHIEPKQEFEVGKWYRIIIHVNVYALYKQESDNVGFIDGRWRCDIQMKNIEIWQKANTDEVKQLLLEEAKRRYPIGTRVRPMLSTESITINTTVYDNVGITDILYVDKTHIINMRVYNNGIWAEIVKPVFTTVDGVNIYKGEYYYFISDNAIEKACAAGSTDSYDNSTKRFHNRTKAEEYLKEHQIKRYKFYGEMLTKEEIFKKAKKLYTIGTICIWNDDTSFITITKDLYLLNNDETVWSILSDDRIIIKAIDDNVDYATIYKPIE